MIRAVFLNNMLSLLLMSLYMLLVAEAIILSIHHVDYSISVTVSGSGD